MAGRGRRVRHHVYDEAAPVDVRRHEQRSHKVHGVVVQHLPPPREVDAGPGGGLPDVVELPVERAHGAAFPVGREQVPGPPQELGLGLGGHGLVDLTEVRDGVEVLRRVELPREGEVLHDLQDDLQVAAGVVLP